jgi:O-antigen/teichoic acid export membrane protein
MMRWGRLESWRKFWLVFPNDIVGILCIGLVISGLTMLTQPDGYRSFYMDVGPFHWTPIHGGVASAVCALICLASKASYAGLALVAATFAGRGVLLFTAWSMGRVDPAPPATRWIWEAINVAIILMAAGKLRRTYR